MINFTGTVYVELENAILNWDHSDEGEYWRSWYETDNFKETIEQLWQQVKPLYQQLHAYVKRKLKDAYPQQRDLFPASGHIPAHITGLWLTVQMYSNQIKSIVFNLDHEDP